MNHSHVFKYRIAVEEWPVWISIQVKESRIGQAHIAEQLFLVNLVDVLHNVPLCFKLGRTVIIWAVLQLKCAFICVFHYLMLFTMALVFESHAAGWTRVRPLLRVN